jgi:hypothetical protein
MRKLLFIKSISWNSTEYQQQVFVYLNLLDETTVEQDKIEEITDFLKEKLNMQIYDSFKALNLKDKISVP